MSTALVLTLPYGIQGFVVYYNESRDGLGCVLMKNYKVIAYASRNLNFHEKKYQKRVLEFVDVGFSLKILLH